jgi:hypothetical protein
MAIGRGYTLLVLAPNHGRQDDDLLGRPHRATI